MTENKDQQDQQKKKMTVEEEAERNEKLLEYDGSDKVVLASTIWKALRKVRAKKAPIRSSFSDLNKKIGGGFFPGQLITISGHSGEGKTTLARTFTKAFISQSVAPLWFSYEETPLQFLEKFPSDTYDFFYMPQELTDNKPNWIEQRIIESKLKYGTRVVFVDHLHFLIDLFRVQNSSLEIGVIVRTLKKLSITQEVVFFLIAHIGKIGKDRELQAGDIRDSSFVEQESDTVMYTWRDKEDHNIVKVTKNREGGVKDFKLTLTYHPATKLLYVTTNEKEEGGRLL